MLSVQCRLFLNLDPYIPANIISEYNINIQTRERDISFNLVSCVLWYSFSYKTQEVSAVAFAYIAVEFL